MTPCVLSVDRGGSYFLLSIVAPLLTDSKKGESYGYSGKIDSTGTIHRNPGLSCHRSGSGTIGPVDIAELLSHLDESFISSVLQYLPASVTGEVLSHLDAELIPQIMKDLGSDRSAQILDTMYSDDVADLLGELTPKEQKRSLRPHGR